MIFQIFDKPLGQKSQKLFFCLIVFFFTCLESQSQPLSILWQQCYGGSADDYGVSVLPANTGYVLFGMSSSTDGQVNGNHGNVDLWLANTDSSGNFLKSTCFGGTGFDPAVKMKSCPDGGYILLGQPFSKDGNITNNHGGSDYWLIKVDKDANLQWQKCFGGSCDDVGWNIAVTSDSGFVVAGFSCSNDGDVTGNHGVFDYWVIKVDKNGILQWEKSLGGSSQDDGLCVTATNDKGFIVGGWTGSTNGNVQCQHHSEIDAWVIKLDSAGNIEWQKCYGGSSTEAIAAIIQLNDGSYMLAGATQSNDGDVSGNHGGFDYWVMKTDPFGNILWQKCYGGSNDEKPTFIKRLSDDNCIIGGLTYSNDGDVNNNHSFTGYGDMWLIKISPEGTLLWQQCFGGTMNENLDDAIELSDKRLLLLGSSFTSNNTGDVQCTHHKPGTYDMWLLMVYDSTMIGVNEHPNIADILEVYPNPAKDQITFSYKSKDNIAEIKIQIVDQMGQIIKVLSMPAKSHEITWNTRTMISGVYFYFYNASNIKKTGKIVIIKS